MVRINYQYKAAILFYMLIVMQEQPESKQDHNHEHHHKHPHDHDHDHHRRSVIRRASRIYNGVRTPRGQAKFMAAMLKSRTGVHCSAVIITGDMLLTAAHCLVNQSLTDWTIMRVLPRAVPIHNYGNNYNLDHHPLIKRITTYWIHPRFNLNSPDKIYDIAIIRIGPEPWPLGEDIDTARMPVRVRHLDWSVIKGYGYGLKTDQRTATYLNEIKFKYLLENASGYQRSNPNVIFCVTNWSPDPNQNPRIYSNTGKGDSGGGIFVKGSVYRLDRSTNRTIIKTGFVLAGIIIKGSNYYRAIANLNRPYHTFAVNVTTMMPWINSIVGVDFETYPFSMPTRRRIG